MSHMIYKTIYKDPKPASPERPEARGQRPEKDLLKKYTRNVFVTDTESNHYGLNCLFKKKRSGYRTDMIFSHINQRKKSVDINTVHKKTMQKSLHLTEGDDED